MDETVLPAKLLDRLSKAADTVRGHQFFHIFSHRDADGISAASIVAEALEREGKEYQITLLKSLSVETMEKVRASLADCVILTDLGSSYIRELCELGKDVIVLDHHTVRFDSETICYVNPHLSGIDGMTDACGATVAFAFAVALDEKNWDLAPKAFIGITGDRQHINGVSGPNAYVLKEAVSRGLLTETPRTLVPPGPLARSLYLSTDPYVRGVSGDMAGTSRLLGDAGIDGDVHGTSLDEGSARKLASLMAVKLASQGVGRESIAESCRNRYVADGVDMETMSTALDSCGKSDLGGIAVAACMGDEDSMAEVMEKDYAVKERTVGLVKKLDETGIESMENIKFFKSEVSGFAGTLCGIAMQFIGDRDKPTVALSVGKDSVKASARGTHAQLDAGVDLAEAMRKAAESVGGEGGGHRIASGASFPAGMEKDFLENLDAIVGDQIRSAT